MLGHDMAVACGVFRDPVPFCLSGWWDYQRWEASKEFQSLRLIWGRERDSGGGFGESWSRTFIGRVQNCILVGIVDIDERKVITFRVQERFPASHCGLLSTMRYVQKATGSFKMQEVTVSNMEDNLGLMVCPGAGPPVCEPTRALDLWINVLFLILLFTWKPRKLKVSGLSAFSFLCTLFCQWQLAPLLMFR